MEEQSAVNGDEHEESDLNGPSGVLIQAEDGDISNVLPEPLGYQTVQSSCGFAGEGNGCAADQMDLEGGGEAGTGL